MFIRDANNFYREVESQTVTIEKTLLEMEIEILQNKICKDDKCQNEDAKLLKDLEKNMGNITRTQWKYITTKYIKYAITESHKSKSPESEKIRNI